MRAARDRARERGLGQERCSRGRPGTARSASMSKARPRSGCRAGGEAGRCPGGSCRGGRGRAGEVIGGWEMGRAPRQRGVGGLTDGVEGAGGASLRPRARRRLSRCSGMRMVCRCSRPSGELAPPGGRKLAKDRTQGLGLPKRSDEEHSQDGADARPATAQPLLRRFSTGSASAALSCSSRPRVASSSETFFTRTRTARPPSYPASASGCADRLRPRARSSHRSTGRPDPADPSRRSAQPGPQPGPYPGP